MEQQTIYRKYKLQDYQYGVQPRIISYKVHKNIELSTDILSTNILLKIQM